MKMEGENFKPGEKLFDDGTPVIFIEVDKDNSDFSLVKPDGWGNNEYYTHTCLLDRNKE